MIRLHFVYLGLWGLLLPVGRSLTNLTSLGAAFKENSGC